MKARSGLHRFHNAVGSRAQRAQGYDFKLGRFLEHSAQPLHVALRDGLQALLDEVGHVWETRAVAHGWRGKNVIVIVLGATHSIA